ncbi:MAG: LamG domain-containing protein, partial [Caldilineaceae bacterium]|nr:LamG domain-containing protein [Caldilineaceae bacterium]
GADSLPIALVAGGSATQTQVAAYDFLEHRAIYDDLTTPRYILSVQQDLPVTTTVQIAYVAQLGGPAQAPLLLTIPAATLAGTSYLLDLGVNEGPAARLTRVTMTPAASDGEAANWWRVTALLGNMAKLLWVLGWERDQIRRQLARTTAQRQVSNALGVSLDLIGYDLGIPRFPPLPYSFDAQSIALYHLNDQAGATPAVEDIIGRYPGQPGHNGTLVGAVTPETPARFGNGFAFLAAAAAVQIPDHSAFALPANQSFTAECFVQPLRGAPDGHLLSKHPDPTGTQAGWVLSVGDFGRGLPLNPRWLLSDGVNPPLALFADLSLATDRFTHLAGVIDRQLGLALLYLDGQVVAQALLGNLQAFTSNAPVQIGHATAALLGVVEEVRISNGARSDFHPVLGESDGSYRQRRRFFRRWMLPTPANLLALLNGAIGPVNGDPHPLIINEVNTDIVGGAQVITINPAALLPGECMDASGNRRVTERATSGSPVEPYFDPLYLISHNDPRVIYAPPAPRVLQPNEVPPDSHKLQLVVERALNRLLDLAAPEAGAGKLTIQSAFDPRATDLRATGRGLLFSHTTIGLGRLAALAQRAAFDFVCYRGDLGMVYASCAQADYLEIVATPAPGFTGKDAIVGDTLTLSVRP